MLAWVQGAVVNENAKWGTVSLTVIGPIPPLMDFLCHGLVYFFDVLQHLFYGGGLVNIPTGTAHDKDVCSRSVHRPCCLSISSRFPRPRVHDKRRDTSRLQRGVLGNRLGVGTGLFLGLQPEPRGNNAIHPFPQGPGGSTVTMTLVVRACTLSAFGRKVIEKRISSPATVSGIRASQVWRNQ